MKLNELAAKLGLTHAQLAFCVADSHIHALLSGVNLFWEAEAKAEARQDWLTSDIYSEPMVLSAAYRIARHPDFQNVIDTAEAAKRCGCGASTIRRWYKDGEIKPVRRARPLARIGKNGGTNTYFWKHGDVAAAAIRHGVYKPGKL